jgi:hypothetical protein
MTTEVDQAVSDVTDLLGMVNFTRRSKTTINEGTITLNYEAIQPDDRSIADDLIDAGGTISREMDLPSGIISEADFANCENSTARSERFLGLILTAVVKRQVVVRAQPASFFNVRS